jgi:hypothetical protein
VRRGRQDDFQLAARLLPEWSAFQLDQAIAATDLDLEHRPAWWSVARLFQWLLFLALWAGLAWWVGTLIWPGLPRPLAGPLAFPLALALGGLSVGWLLSGLSRLAVGAQAKAKAATASRRLRRAISQVTQRSVLGPVNEELRRHNQAQADLNLLLAPRRRAS